MKSSDVIRAVRALVAWNKRLNVVATVPGDPYRAGFQAGIIAALDGLDEELRGAIAQGTSTRAVLEQWANRKESKP